jgi:hypothetical protein
MEENDSPTGVKDFLPSLDLSDRADLVNSANNGFTAFLGHWPPIERRWIPRFEQWANYEALFDGTLHLRAKHDLALGIPTGTTARTIIVDVKTGKLNYSHPEELRFYALVETLRAGVPPFRVASYYTRSGMYPAQDVTEDMLFQTADKLVQVVRRMWELNTAQSEPSRVPGGLCEYYCPLYSDCEVGQRYVAERGE